MRGAASWRSVSPVRAVGRGAVKAQGTAVPNDYAGSAASGPQVPTCADRWLGRDVELAVVEMLHDHIHRAVNGAEVLVNDLQRVAA